VAESRSRQAVGVNLIAEAPNSIRTLSLTMAESDTVAEPHAGRGVIRPITLVMVVVVVPRWPPQTFGRLRTCRVLAMRVVAADLWQGIAEDSEVDNLDDPGDDDAGTPEQALFSAAMRTSPRATA
jgi:hypothetical protein